jgi:2-polyprenyl-3-methyl-5-hydroxy-6-metoxy-1,4-benzoquinol methylase
MSQDEDVQRWWAENPMTYGTVHGQANWKEKTYEMGTKEFYQCVDEEFYRWNSPLHGQRPFDRLFPYDAYSNGARVLEIGCGMGTMAMNWAKNGAQVTAVDLTPTAVHETQRRFSLFGLQGKVLQMDANNLALEAESFDYVYSFGVLHHSPDLQKSLSEMMRVLRPGGGFGLMLYCRDSIRYRYRMRYVEEFLHYEGRFLGPLELASRYTDAEEDEGNMYTWPVTEQEIRRMLGTKVADSAFRRLGGELDGIFKRLVPGLGLVLPVPVKKAWARRYGWSLWAEGHKA